MSKNEEKKRANWPAILTGLCMIAGAFIFSMGYGLKANIDKEKLVNAGVIVQAPSTTTTAPKAPAQP